MLLVLALCAVVFVLQLILCFRCGNFCRYAPVCILGSLELGLWSSFFLIRPGFYVYYGGMAGLFLLGAGMLAWAVWAIVQLIQKRR